MRCPRCNREAKDGVIFCPACGAPLTLRAEPVSSVLDSTLNIDRRAAGEVRSAPPPPAAQPKPRPVAPAPPTAHPPPRPASPAPVPPARPREPVARTVPPSPPSPLPPVSEPSHWDMRLSQMPRERRPDLGPEPAPPARPSARPSPPAREIREETPVETPDPTLDVVIDPAEVHLRRASSWRRAAAWLIDGIPFAALFAFALRLALDKLTGGTSRLDLAGALELAGAEAEGITFPLLAGTLVIFAVYHALSHGLSGATLGKRLVGIRVVGPNGRRPGLGRAAIRAVLSVVSLLLLFLGVLLALFTRSGRALHDFLARTWVVES